MLFIKGIARSGKSTIITNGFKHFYDASDVKTISNKIEPQFGCSALAGGFLCIAPEVKSNYSFPQAEFQSFVSGEDVSLAQKHGMDGATLAQAWAYSRFYLSCVIIGATSLEQLEANWRAATVQLSDQCLQAIDEIHLRRRDPNKED